MDSPVVLFNVTGPTDIYPYLHTLSLHDALPISGMSSRATPAGASASRTAFITAAGAPDVADSPAPFTPSGLSASTTSSNARVMNGRRSEEHPSELQSLMRISYAVYCLNKTKHARRRSRMTIRRKDMPTTR